MPHMRKHIFEKAWAHIESICEGQSPSQALSIFTHDVSNLLHISRIIHIYKTGLTSFFIRSDNVWEKSLNFWTFGWCVSKLLNGRNLCHMSRIRVQIWVEIHNANHENNLKTRQIFVFCVDTWNHKQKSTFCNCDLISTNIATEWFESSSNFDTICKFLGTKEFKLKSHMK